MIPKTWNEMNVVVQSPQCSLFSKVTTSNEVMSGVTDYVLPDINILKGNLLV